MKNFRCKSVNFLALALFVTAASFFMAGCAPEGMSIDDRIDAFMDDANSGQSLRDHFSDASKSLILDTDLIGDGQQLDYEVHNPLDWTKTGKVDNTVTGTIDRTGSVTTVATVFVMKKETLTGLMGGEDWKILSVTVNGDTFP